MPSVCPRRLAAAAGAFGLATVTGAVGLGPAVSAEPAAPARPESAAPIASAPPAAGLPAPKPAIPAEPVKLSADPNPSLSPQTPALIQAAIDRYAALVEAGGWPAVPNEATLLKPGARSPAIRRLRERLATAGDLGPEARAGDAFDEAVRAGLKRFQARHGLEETGAVGPRTLALLNVPADARLRQLRASAARLAGSRFPFGERYVVVNIPGQAVEAVVGGIVVRRHVAVVGKPDRPSPAVETRITAVNFNPTWTVPVSLIKKDIIPHVRKEPGYLARMKIRVLDGSGQEVDPARIDWSTEAAANFTLRQDAGGENSLGEVRIDMPNRLAVYMHDTPSKGLFARNRRFQSSGCVRVAGVKDFAAWILEGSPGPAGAAAWGAAEIEAAIASGKRVDAKPVRPIPVAWTYLTGYATPDGTVHFRDDVYGLDEPRPAPVALAPAPAGSARDLTIGDLAANALAERR